MNLTTFGWVDGRDGRSIAPFDSARIAINVG